jgi:hypothetical protein
MSTTDDLEVALYYADSNTPLIFRYEARGRSCGVDICFASLYPKEQEYLYAPLTGLVLLRMHQMSVAELRALAKLNDDYISQELQRIESSLESTYGMEDLHTIRQELKSMQKMLHRVLNSSSFERKESSECKIVTVYDVRPMR